MGQIFISYSHKDKEYVHKLQLALMERGIHAWIDDRIDYGSEWPDEIEKRLQECSAFVLVMTPNAKRSHWVKNELHGAIELEKPIFSLLLEDKIWWYVKSIQAVDVKTGNMPPEDFFRSLMRIQAVEDAPKFGDVNIHVAGNVSGTINVGDKNYIENKPIVFPANTDPKTQPKLRHNKRITQPVKNKKLPGKSGEPSVNDIEHPVDPGELPVTDIEHPVEHGELPVNDIEHPVERGELPVSDIERPVERGELPVNDIERPAEPSELPVNNIEYPVERGELPVNDIEHPVEPGELPVNDIEHPFPIREKMPIPPRKRNLTGLAPILGACMFLSLIGIAGIWAFSNLPKSTQLPTSTAKPAIPVTIITPYPTEISQKGAVMLLIHGGSLMMGSDTGDDDEKPLHQVTLSTFYMDKYEVSNALYKACVDDGGCRAPAESKSFTRESYYGNTTFDNYPVVYVDWHQTKTYCEWRGARLPTEAEWEYAARGTDGRTYPWGNNIDPTRANYGQNVGDTTPVDSYETGKSPFGIYNMAGNVLEWVNDLYDEMYYQSSPSDNPQGPAIGQYPVLRGGEWLNNYSHIRSAERNADSKIVTRSLVGFRCARSP